MKLFCRRLLPAVLIAALGLTIFWQPMFGLVLCAIALLWWWRLRPSNERDWSPEYARTPWAEIDGDAVVLHNFRNFTYRSGSDPIPRWETKTVHLSQLRGLDFFMNFFGSRHVAHTFLSFDFGPDGYVCTSIEARRERGEPYSPWRGLLRQYELYYVIGDERDLIRLRTEQRGQPVHLYRLAEAPVETYRSLFLAYLRSANEIRTHPRWYHAALDNCTTNIRQNARVSGFASTWNWRLLLNGHADELLHRRGMIPSSLPFAQTRARGRINERARAAGDAADFSERIRQPDRSEPTADRALQSPLLSGMK